MTARRKPVVAYSDHYDTRPPTLRFASESAPEWAECSVPLFRESPTAREEAAVVKAALWCVIKTRYGAAERPRLEDWQTFEDAVNRLNTKLKKEIKRLEKKRGGR